jgi:Response regulator containing CheY-like receiver domain and AraC-type DNA-binding domain
MERFNLYARLLLAGSGSRCVFFTFFSLRPDYARFGLPYIGNLPQKLSFFLLEQSSKIQFSSFFQISAKKNWLFPVPQNIIANMASGLYKKKLLKVFFVVAVVLAFNLCFLISGILFYRNSDAYRKGLSNVAVARADSLRLSLDIINDVLTEAASGEDGRLWVYSEPDSSEYYYNALKIYKSLSRASSLSGNLEYEIALTTADDDSFVITQGGTVSRSYFIENCISAELWNRLCSSPAASGVLAGYNLGHLEYLVYYLKQRTGLIAIARIQLSSVVTEKDNVVLKIGDEFFRFHENDDFSLPGAEETKEEGSITSFSSRGRYIYKINTVLPSLSFLFLFPKFNASFLMLTAFGIMLFIVILSLSFLFAFIIARRLYAPISSAVNRIETEGEGAVDEFALLAEKLDSMSLLKDKLDKLSSENSDFALNRYYGDLLFTPHPLSVSPLSDAQEKAEYMVALVDMGFDESSDEYFLQLQRTIISMAVEKAKRSLTLYAENLTFSRFAIIFESGDTATAEAALMKMTEAENLEVLPYIALSEPERGTERIVDCAREADRILEYRHLHEGRKILRKSDIPTDSSSYFYYPIFIENRLVAAATSGNREECMKVFDLVIEENFGKLSLTLEARQNLVYSLIGTQLRIMQELKTTAAELIGRNFDFPWLYSNWANEKIIHRLRNNISEIAVAVDKRKKAGQSDEYILAKMRDYIYENFSDDIMLVDISEYCHISPKYCSMLFKKLSNENFKTFLNEYRIERASEMIRKNPYIKINDLASAVGFNSSNTFIRVFKSFKNTTPGSYADEIIRLNSKGVGENDQTGNP